MSFEGPKHGESFAAPAVMSDKVHGQTIGTIPGETNILCHICAAAPPHGIVLDSWRAILVRMGADPTMAKARTWADLSITTRADILKAIR